MAPGEENNGLTEDENKELERNYRLWSKIISEIVTQYSRENLTISKKRCI